MIVRSRFAPSPTGRMHVGNIRTALFSWLYARNKKGVFILRIEDTDRERSTDESIQVILEAMDWLKLDYDEGPYFQTDRFPRYNEVIQHMLEKGLAYRCYCPKERLDQLREEQFARKEKPRYDGHCRDLQAIRPDESFVVRFKNPTEGSVRFHDLVHGDIEIQNSELDDLIIAREDGTPTYNFTVVVDEIDMHITHVIRGDDHINNTPRQINLLNALGGEIPEYAHLSMILGKDGKRLSKRHGAVGALEFREEGFLPKALLNYMIRLGWAHGDQEIFSREEMIDLFDLSAVNKAAAIFDTEKLLWLNQHYIKTLPPEEIAKELKWHMEKQQIDITKGPDLTELVRAQAERSKTLKEMVEKSRYFYEDFEKYDEKAAAKHLKPENKVFLTHILETFQSLDRWEAETLHEIIMKTAETAETKMGVIAQPIRVAITGNTVSPPIDITLELMGKKRVIERLEKAIRLGIKSENG